MQLVIAADTKDLQKLARRFPNAAGIAADNFIERVGFTIEGQAKKEAPIVEGNLRRSIFFKKNSPVGGSRVHAFANYAPYVHGDPYHNTRMKRRQTPFFTRAIINSGARIKQYERAIIKDIERNI